jgi:hypothetical protein
VLTTRQQFATWSNKGATGATYHCDINANSALNNWCDGKPEVIKDKQAFGSAVILSLGIMNNWIPDPTDGATHYHATWVNPDWTLTMTPTTRVKNHIFYR